MSLSLVNQTNQQTLSTSVQKAFKLWERTVGLLGKKDIPNDFALWISPCPSIHTFFMKFPIDVIFTDKQLRVVSTFHSVKSGKVIWGGKTSHSVFEMKADQLKNYKINKGDQLYVGH